MALPKSSQARPFYRVAQQRLEDAQFLLRGQRTTAAIYLAGYAVECILKALLLNGVNTNQGLEILNSFRGNKAHDYIWIVRQIRTRKIIGNLPLEFAKAFRTVNTWTTELRYHAGLVNREEAESFVGATSTIFTWASGRM